ncbi:MAG TPA: glycine cleavage system protein GcvH [Candidatus Hydrothermia bacterium]|nr:glycine cleavage system protein GcvH [Candidatus Hydrothermae bacterium]MDD3648702.1 glycine cleavage system protein GcvH [Candidatus Hydrothermia bacterium]MDD5572796.1 glycine cleavage system protein GcvH [Candidatus Hydrothermia bacterium]HRD23066.1 glycine cleavage system protein GcvH [Candidatus Hydrothermia bacterium]
MLIPDDLKYTREHEWVKVLDKDIAVIGVTDFAQSELSDVVYVELPAVNKKVNKGEEVASVEAVKTVASVYSPVSGEVIEVNERLKDDPSLINKDPYGDGWICKIKISNPQELDDFLSAEQYKKLIAEE